VWYSLSLVQQDATMGYMPNIEITDAPVMRGDSEGT
jgi:hypothetical protein